MCMSMWRVCRVCVVRANWLVTTCSQFWVVFFCDSFVPLSPFIHTQNFVFYAFFYKNNTWERRKWMYLAASMLIWICKAIAHYKKMTKIWTIFSIMFLHLSMPCVCAYLHQCKKRRFEEKRILLNDKLCLMRRKKLISNHKTVSEERSRQKRH